MNAENFCYWLNGFFELKKTIDHRDGFTPETIKAIEDHLQLVFKKETPIRQITTQPSMPRVGDSTFPPYNPNNPIVVTC